MFSSTILSFLLIGVSLSTILCTECKKPDPKECTGLSDLATEESAFAKWAKDKCPTDKTVIAQGDVDTYKKCVEEHLTPVFEGKEFEGLKKIFVDLMHDKELDLCHVCCKETQDKIEHKLMKILEDHSDMEEQGKKKCADIKEAMCKVMECAKIPH